MEPAFGNNACPEFTEGTILRCVLRISAWIAVWFCAKVVLIIWHWERAVRPGVSERSEEKYRGMAELQSEHENENEDFCKPADRVFLNEVKKCIEGCGGTSE
jgi:hypothetical protein